MIKNILKLCHVNIPIKILKGNEELNLREMYNRANEGSEIRVRQFLHTHLNLNIDSTGNLARISSNSDSGR